MRLYIHYLRNRARFVCVYISRFSFAYHHLFTGSRRSFVKGGKSSQISSNGLTGLAAVTAAKAAQVPRVVVLGATIPKWGSAVMTGYTTGKAIAAAAAAKYTQNGAGAVVLQPGAIYGTRHITEAKVPLPLGLVMAPVRWLMEIGPVASGISWLVDMVTAQPTSRCDSATALFREGVKFLTSDLAIRNRSPTLSKVFSWHRSLSMKSPVSNLSPVYFSCFSACHRSTK